MDFVVFVLWSRVIYSINDNDTIVTSGFFSGTLDASSPTPVHLQHPSWIYWSLFRSFTPSDINKHFLPRGNSFMERRPTYRCRFTVASRYRGTPLLQVPFNCLPGPSFLVLSAQSPIFLPVSQPSVSGLGSLQGASQYDYPGLPSWVIFSRHGILTTFAHHLPFTSHRLLSSPPPSLRGPYILPLTHFLFFLHIFKIILLGYFVIP